MDAFCRTRTPDIKYFLSTNGSKKLTNFCRACLKKRGDMRFLLDNTEETNTLIAKFATVLNLDVELKSKLPSYFCKICEKKVNTFFEFMEQCKTSNDLIYQYFETFESQNEACKSEESNTSLESLYGIDSAHNDDHYNYSMKCKSEYSDDEDSVKIKTQTSYICYHCNELYVSREKLQAHLLVHNEENHAMETLGVDSHENLSTDEDDEDVKGTDLHDDFELFKTEEMPNGYNQKVRLEQYKFEDVDRVVKTVRKKLTGHVTCVLCQFQATSTRSLSVHMTTMHRKSRGQWCLRCNKLFKELITHKKTFHAEDLKCPFCNKIQQSLGSFMEHMASHSGNRLHRCTICNKSFMMLKHLKNHQMIHVGGCVLGCKICKKKFLQMKNLRRHVRLVHKRSVEPQNYCQKCDKKVRSLPQHNTKHHSLKPTISEDQPSLCPHCGKQFNNQYRLNRHLRTHTGEMPYKCQHCDKRLKTKSGLIVHERTHTGEKPYICTICKKSFNQSSVLTKHLRTHTGWPEQCTICKKKMCNPAELRLHLRKHSGEKPYICDICDRAFKQKNHLMLHMRRHSKDGSHKCNVCEEVFNKIDSFKCHLKIHADEKPLKCSQCSYVCKQAYSLTQHLQQHKNDRRQPSFPRTCKICQRKYSNVAYLMNHYNRFHPHVKIKLIKKRSDLNSSNDQIRAPNDQFFAENVVPEEQAETTIIQNEVDEPISEFTNYDS